MEGVLITGYTKCEANRNCHNSLADGVWQWIAFKCVDDIKMQWWNNWTVNKPLRGTIDCSLWRIIITSKSTQQKNTKSNGWKEKICSKSAWLMCGARELRFWINEEVSIVSVSNSTFFGNANLWNYNNHTTWTFSAFVLDLFVLLIKINDFVKVAQLKLRFEWGGFLKVIGDIIGKSELLIWKLVLPHIHTFFWFSACWRLLRGCINPFTAIMCQIFMW